MGGSGKSGRRRRRLFVVLAAVVAVFILIGASSVSGAEGIKRGVQVGNVELGGMSKAEAREALRGKTAPRLQQVSLGEQQTMPARQLGVTVDPEQSVRAAYAVGREGWIGGRAYETLRGYFGGVEVPAAVSYDEQTARQAIAGLTDEVRQEPEDASYEVSGDEMEVVGGDPGQKLDVQQTLANLDESLSSMDGQVRLATTGIEPEKTVDELQSDAPTEKLGEFETDYRYSDSEARKDNLEMSANAVNGTVMEPGETFSMNEHLIGLDYKEAKVFAEGGESTALGGGLCQVTSTVYMAAQYAGMEIVERTPHYTTLPYIRPGFDATVWFGGQGIEPLDMKFKNTNDSNILVREYVTEKGILKAEIWGQPNGKEVEMRSEQDFKDTERGIQWSTYKTVKEDGEIVRQGKLREDLYSYPPPEASEEGYNQVRVGGWSG